MKLLYKLLFISMMGMIYAECENIDNQIDCEALEGCEWHADEMACEDAGHDDHEHCEDITDQTECEADDHCIWEDGMCEDEHDHGDGDCAETDHFDTDGLELEHDGEEIYSQFQGLIEGSVELHVNHSMDLSVHFLDPDGNEIEIDESIIDCYELSFNVADSSIISVGSEDHDDDHGDDDHAEGHTFEISGLSVGSTTFTISIMHQGHADYTSMPILVTVTEEEHCDELTEDECLESDHCEWHADEMACEDAGHDDHEHCDELTEDECLESDHCEWHADEMACEDERHDDHEHCEDITDQTE